MSNIKIENIIDFQEWANFLLNQPYGNVFQTPELYEVYLKTDLYEPIVLFARNDNNKIVGVLQAVIQKEYEGILGVFSSRSIIWGGPLVDNNNTEIAFLLIEAYNKIAKKKAIYSQFRNLFDMSIYKEQFGILDYNYEEHLDIHINLEKSEDELWKELHTKRRNEVRRSKKEGVDFELRNDKISLQCSYEILREVYKRAKLPLPKYTLFDNLLKVGNSDFRLLNFSAVYEGKIIGCMLVLAYNNVLYDFYAGSYQEYYKKYPNDLIPWEILLWGKKNGYKLFDFGGAGKPDVPYGVRDYKLKFGGELVNFGRFEKIHKPILFQIGKLGLKLWKLLK